MKTKKQSKVFFALFVIIISVCISNSICFAQEQEKSIQSEDLVKKRPAARASRLQNGRTVTNSTNSKSNKNVKQKKRFYRVVKSPQTEQRVKISKPVEKDAVDALLGLTVWKIRPATESDAAKELVEEEQGGKVQNSEYTLERMELDTPIAIGERIRFSIESLSHSGYLYVVERELYDDGTYSSPKLIYPTLRTRNRNSQISAGSLIFVPEAPRYFRVTSNQSKKKQVAEVLTIIVSPKVLIDQSMLQIKAIDLPLEQLTNWLMQWEVYTTLLEQIDGAGQTITLVEQSVGQDSAKGLTEESSSLTQDDALPQSIFRTKIKHGSPLLVNILLKFRTN